jgi:hypothetical protein
VYLQYLSEEIGSRATGSMKNEIITVQYLVSTLEAMKVMKRLCLKVAEQIWRSEDGTQCPTRYRVLSQSVLNEFQELIMKEEATSLSCATIISAM